MCTLCRQTDPAGTGCSLDGSLVAGTAAGALGRHQAGLGTTGSGSGSVTSYAAGDVLTYDQIADQLTTGYWGGASHAFNVSPGDILYVNYAALTADGRFFAQKALEAWSMVSGIIFSTVTPPPGQNLDITFDDNQSGAFCNTVYGAGGAIVSSQVNISTAWIAGDSGDISTYSMQTYIHEIGHAIGLGHAGNYNGAASYGVDNDYLNDSWQASVMSYFDQTDNTYIDASYAYVITPMIADILAIQDLYGVATTLRTGNTIYGANSTAGGYYDSFTTLNDDVTFTIIDNGGIDTLDLSLADQAATINLNDGTVSSYGGLTGNLIIMRNTVIEDLQTGAGADRITGNEADNTFRTGLGADTINGATGRDTVAYDGAAGAVTVYLMNGVVSGAAGADRLTSIEDLVGSDFADALIGNAGANHIAGGDGNDKIKSKGGSDVLWGEGGSDVLTGDAGQETLTGGDGADSLSGFAGSDLIAGDDGNDYLYGGDDNDTVDGGIGNDRLFGNRGNDGLSGGAGIDTVYGGAGNDDITGGGDTDYLYAEAGDDVLNGEAGNDRLFGGTGIDTFVFGPAGGYDYIRDWEDGTDLIDLAAWGFAAFADVLALAQDFGAGVRLDFADTSMLLIENFTLALFDQGDVSLA